VVPGYDFIASNKSNSFEEAVSKTSEALERQIEKRKTKLKRASLRFSS
jgi:ribosome-associated translation inhibitor RaiA